MFWHNREYIVLICPKFQFDAPQFSVEGKSAINTYDESRLYWTPAPPKLDVAPANVKEVLFPEYQVTF